MKKYTMPLLILLFIGSVIWELNKLFKEFSSDNTLSLQTTNKPTPTPITVPNGNVTETEIGGKKYYVMWVKVPNNSRISLIPNFTERIFGEVLAENNSCDAAINGGFYLGSGQPLGFFITNNKNYGKITKSNIANTFVWQDNAGDVRFVKSVPEYLGFTDFIFQSGPYIIPANKSLNLIQDEWARRSLIGKDIRGNIYFITVANKDNLVGGPHLADIPVIFWMLKQKNIIAMEELVNLDGGSASFFYSKDKNGEFKLTSWAPIGSLLCMKIAN